MTLLLALVLAVEPMTVKQGRSLDGGYTAWAVQCLNCSGGGGVSSSVAITGAVGVNILDAGGPLNINPPASLPLPTGAATGAKQDTGNTSLGSIDGKLPALVSSRVPVDPSGVTSPVSLASVPAHGLTGQVSVNITDAGAPLNVQGAFFQTTQPVSLASVPTHAVTGTFWQSTQPVSIASMPSTPVTGPISVNLLDGGAPLNVQGTFWQTTQPVSLASAPTTPVTGTFWQATQPVSGTFWQAIQPISGTVTANAGTGTMAVSGPLTDTQLRASAVPVTLTSTTITGTVAATQSGTWTVQPGNTANTTAWKVDGSAVTQPVSIAGTVAVSMAGSNPCQNPGATLAAVAGATSGTVAVQLVALSGTTKIYLCTVNITGISGTTPTFSLKYGTGTACATGGVTILGPWTTAANTVYTFNQPFVTPAGQALCYLDTGTTPIQNYAITYVQQ